MMAKVAMTAVFYPEVVIIPDVKWRHARVAILNCLVVIAFIQ
jgi:hypothetical protein